MSLIKESFIQSALQTHPQLKQADLDPLISENLLCPVPLHLPKEIFTQAKDLVSHLYKIRQIAPKPAGLDLQFNQLQLIDPGHASVCMSYDVHWSTSAQKLKLIEVNTNASFLFLSYHLYQAHQLENELIRSLPESIRKSFETEKKLWAEVSNPTKSSDEKIKSIAIIDDKPTEQRLYAEFLVANEFFKSWGWDSQILDFRSVTDKFDFVYNRTTDFYLNQPESAHLRKIWKEHFACVSPQPAEYFHLADKQRMIEWFQPEWQKILQDHPSINQALNDYVPPCLALETMDFEQIREARKKYFFKPKNAFGSKQAYSGDSISRKLLQSLDLSQFIAQEKIPAAEVEISTPEGPQKMKYDLRIFAYQNQVQNIVARLYQGQVTNLSTRYGGFAPVIFD
jgi:hypothetical protein